jgi:hypothetical protein
VEKKILPDVRFPTMTKLLPTVYYPRFSDAFQILQVVMSEADTDRPCVCQSTGGTATTGITGVWFSVVRSTS